MHINADHLLRNHAAIVRVCSAGTWLAVLADKMLIHRFDNDVFDVGCGKQLAVWGCRRLLSFASEDPFTEPVGKRNR